MLSLNTFAQAYSYTTTTTTTTSNGTASLGAIMAIYVALLVLCIPLLIIPLWKIYKKAGKPGWAAIIPIYSTYVLFEITGYPGWWAILSLVPVVNIFPAIISLIAYFKLAKAFGKGDGFAVCMVLFPWVCIPILGYGKAQFQGNGSAVPTDPPYPMNPQPPVAPQPYQPEAPEQPAGYQPPQPVVQPATEAPQPPASYQPEAPQPPVQPPAPADPYLQPAQPPVEPPTQPPTPPPTVQG